MLTFVQFAIAHFIGFITPGPGFLLVATNSIEYGKKAGITTSLGLNIAYTIHLIIIFNIVKDNIHINLKMMNGINIFGALFLLFLAFKSFTNKGIKKLDKMNDLENRYLKTSKTKLVVSSFLVGILNSKGFLLCFFLLKNLANKDKLAYYTIWIPFSLFFYHLIMIKTFTTSNIRRFFIHRINYLNKVFGVMLIMFAIKAIINIKI